MARCEQGIQLVHAIQKILQNASDISMEMAADAVSKDLLELARWLRLTLEDAMARGAFRDNVCWVRMVLSRLRLLRHEYCSIVMRLVRLRESRRVELLRTVDERLLVCEGKDVA